MSDRFIKDFDDLTIVRAKTTNGGKGSGFHGHYGRPGLVGGSSSQQTPFNYDEMLATDNIGEAQKIAIDLCYKVIDDIENKHPELIDREQQDKNLRNNYEVEYLKWKNMPDRVHDLSYEEYKQKVLAREIDAGGRELLGFHPVHSLALYGAGASPFLEGFLMYVMGANIYHLDREGFDKEHKISETIDKNPDLWTDYKKPLYRGLSTNDEGIAELKKGAVVSMQGLSSWTSEKDIADHFTKYALYQTGKNPVVFIDKSKKHKGTMFYPFSSAMAYGPQYEYVQSGSNRYKITDVRKDGDIYYADVETD